MQTVMQEAKVRNRDLASEVAGMVLSGFRLSRVVSMAVPGGRDLLYSFSKSDELRHLKLDHGDTDAAAQSVIGPYLATLTYENRIQDLWIMQYDVSSCNRCDMESLDCLASVYEAKRFGIVSTGNPKNADILILTGDVNDSNIEAIRGLYERMPRPNAVMAVGDCAMTGGIFRECSNARGGADSAVPVDVRVPGCAARPEAIIGGIAQAIEVLGRKVRLGGSRGPAWEAQT